MSLNGKEVAFNGDIRYYNKNGQYHREDGPAIEWSDGRYTAWILNGKNHRVDGPARIKVYLDGTVDQAWFYHGKKMNCSSQEEFERLLKLKAFW